VLNNVPPGQYEIVAWHEGWRVIGESPMFDVMTQTRVKRPVFSDAVSWSKSVTVAPGKHGGSALHAGREDAADGARALRERLVLSLP
jgi:hypothetical protein